MGLQGHPVVRPTLPALVNATYRPSADMEALLPPPGKPCRLMPGWLSEIAGGQVQYEHVGCAIGIPRNQVRCA